MTRPIESQESTGNFGGAKIVDIRAANKRKPRGTAGRPEYPVQSVSPLAGTASAVDLLNYISDMSAGLTQMAVSANALSVASLLEAVNREAGKQLVIRRNATGS